MHYPSLTTQFMSSVLSSWTSLGTNSTVYNRLDTLTTSISYIREGPAGIADNLKHHHSEENVALCGKQIEQNFGNEQNTETLRAAGHLSPLKIK